MKLFIHGLGLWVGLCLMSLVFSILVISPLIQDHPAITAAITLTASQERDQIVTLEAQQAGVPVSLALAVSHVENTSGDSMAVSSAGAVGLMQVLPKYHQHAFEAECGCGSLFLRHRNACVGVRVLKQYRLQQGTWEGALRAYHGSLRLPTVGRKYVASVLDQAFPAIAPTAEKPDGTTVNN